MEQWRIFLFLNSFLYLIFFVLGQSSTPAPDPTPSYQFKKVLDDDGNYELFWNIAGDTILFEVNVRTLGYVGFGLSKDRTGKMSPADMIIGWVQENNVYFGDYQTVGEDSHVPIYDTVQDWNLRSRPGLRLAKEENGYTTIAFERKLDTCDDDDLRITGDTMMVIYSYSDTDPNVTTGIFPHHGPNRGSKYIFFKHQPPVPELFPPPGSYRIPLRISDYDIPTQLYSRQCLVYNVTEAVTPNSYLIMYEPAIQQGNEPFVYRMILYQCHVKDQVLVNNRFDCTDGGSSAIKACTNIIATWSMGAEPFYFPEGMGIFSGPSDPYTFVLQIHYINGRGVAGIVDNSGLDVMFTTTPRPTKAAFLSIGSVISTNLRQVILPGERKFKTSTFCSQRCLQWGFERVSSRKQVIGVIFHGNDIAREMKLRHFRNNVELPWIDSDKNYDSFYQSVRLFEQPVTIENQTDIISLDCTYNSTDRTSLTKGGWSQIQELCRATLIYTPPLPIDQCLSWSSLDQMVSSTGQAIPENMTMQYLDHVDKWDTGAKNRFNNAMRLSRQKALCSSQKQTPNYALDRFENPSIQDIMEYKEPGSACPTGNRTRGIRSRGLL